MINANVTREKYIKEIFKTYKLVSVLSEKNGCKVLRLRHIKAEKDLVLHSLPKPVALYEALCKIQCNNLPVIYDVFDVKDGQIVLEEFIDGMTVAQVMESGKYQYFGARKVLKSVCNALTVIHNQNFVHRDIKPENIMIDKNGRVVLIDFNASRKISFGSRDTEILGTVGYASPEQLGVMQSDARTDVYALGILLNVMITGKHPSEILSKGRVGRIVKKCTSVSPDNRFKSVEKLCRML